VPAADRRSRPRQRLNVPLEGHFEAVFRRFFPAQADRSEFADTPPGRATEASGLVGRMEARALLLEAGGEL
jgi:hypothetical protein